MQVSTYEIILPFSKDRHVLVNGLYGAVDIVSSEEAELITQAKNDSSLLERLNSSRLDMFIERGHIVRDMNQEAQDMRIISRLHTLLRGRAGIGIVLMPTYDCNLRCVYCYERHRLSRGLEWLEHTMTPSVLEDIFMQVKDFKARGYIVKSCTLYGGEPLLARNKALIRDICERCRENDLTISAITNGCELEHFIDIIEEFKFTNLQITVDGLKEIHDSQRPFADGGSSYDKIMNNIGLALKRGIGVSLRSNITGKSISGIKNLMDEFKSRGFTDNSHFRYYFKAAEYDMSTVSDADVLNELIRTGISHEEAVRLESSYIFAERGFASWMGKNTFPVLNPTYCGSMSGMYVIDPYGKIFPCWDTVGKDGEEIGFVEDGGFMYNFNVAKWHTRTSDRMQECSKCPFLMLCGGGCAKAGIKALMKANCDSFQDRFAFVAPIVIKKAMNGDYAGKKENHDKNDGSKNKGVKSKYADDPSCLSLSFHEFLCRLNPDERNILMTTDSEKKAMDIVKAHTVM